MSISDALTNIYRVERRCLVVSSLLAKMYQQGKVGQNRDAENKEISDKIYGHNAANYMSVWIKRYMSIYVANLGRLLKSDAGGSCLKLL